MITFTRIKLDGSVGTDFALPIDSIIDINTHAENADHSWLCYSAAFNTRECVVQGTVDHLACYIQNIKRYTGGN